MGRHPVRRSLLAVAAVWTIVSPSTVIAAAATFTFDTATRMFVQPPGAIHSGARVELVVTNPNTFRESYTLTLLDEDYHTAPIATGLASIIVTAPAAIESLPQTGTRVRMAGHLEDSYDHAVGVLRALQDTLRARSAEMQHPLVVPFLGSLAAQRDNGQVHLRAARECGRLATLWCGSGDLAARYNAAAQGTSPDKLRELAIDCGEIIVCFDSTTNAWFVGWETAADDWDRKYMVWKAGKHTPVEIENAAGWDAEIQGDRKWALSVKTKIDQSRQELTGFVEIARVALDPLRTPLELRKIGFAAGDQVVARVTVQPIVLISEVRKDLPKSAETTISISAPVHGRFVLSASGGFAASRLVHRNYITTPDSTGGYVREGSRDKVNLVPAAFVHLIYTFPHGWGAGPMIGISASSPVRYLAGAGIELGRRARLLLSGGVAWGEVDVLNGEQVDHPLVTSPLSTQEVVRTSGFVSASVSFALPGK